MRHWRGEGQKGKIFGSVLISNSIPQLRSEIADYGSDNGSNDERQSLYRVNASGIKNITDRARTSAHYHRQNAHGFPLFASATRRLSVGPMIVNRQAAGVFLLGLHRITMKREFPWYCVAARIECAMLANGSHKALAAH